MDVFTQFSTIPKSNAMPAGTYEFEITDLKPGFSSKNPNNVLLKPQLKPTAKELQIYPSIFDNTLFLCYSDSTKSPEQEARQLIRTGQILRALAAQGTAFDMSHLINKTPAELLNLAMTYLKPHIAKKKVWAKVKVGSDGRNEVVEYLEAAPVASGAQGGLVAPAGMPGGPAAPGGLAMPGA